MGNGAVSKENFVNGEHEKSTNNENLNNSKLQQPLLSKELNEKDELLQRKDVELKHRMKTLDEKDAEIAKLKKEIHELKCVVQQTANKFSVMSTISEDSGMGNSPDLGSKMKKNRPSRKEKRQAVSGESSSKTQEESKKDLVRFPKDFRYFTIVVIYKVCLFCFDWSYLTKVT